MYQRLGQWLTHGPPPPPNRISASQTLHHIVTSAPLRGDDDWDSIVESGLHFIVFACGPSTALAGCMGRVEKGRGVIYVLMLRAGHHCDCLIWASSTMGCEPDGWADDMVGILLPLMIQGHRAHSSFQRKDAIP